MAFTEAGLNAAVEGITSAAATVTFHTADPGDTGANAIAGAEGATTWSAAAGGTATGSQVSVDIPGGTTVTHWGLEDGAGNFLYGGALDANETFGSDGTLLHTPTVTVDNS